MLFFDLIDILYVLLGVAIGAIIQAYVDMRTCDDCIERRNKNE